MYSSRRARRTSSTPGLFALTALLVAAPPEEANDPQNLPPADNSRYNAAVLGDTEGELNCDELSFPRAGLRLVMQAEADAGAERRAELRVLAKIAIRRSILEADGLLADLHDKGAIAGLEVDWFFPGGAMAPSPDDLDVVGELWGTDDVGEPVLHARVHAYDEAQYTQRVAKIEAMLGHPMHTYDVWAGDVLTSVGAAKDLQVFGAANSFHGRAASAGDLRLIGPSNCSPDGLAAVGKIEVEPSCTVGSEEKLATLSVLAPAIGEKDARALAKASGTYSAGSLFVSPWSLPANGTVFAEGDIVVWSNGVERQWTLTSGSGDIIVLGSGNTIRPHTHSTAALAYDGSVVLLGGWNHLEGELMSVASPLYVLGNWNLLHGILVGEGLLIGGSGNVVTDGTHPH